MDGDLMRYSTGGGMVPMRDRAVAKQAKETYDAVRSLAHQADGSMALAAHIMDGAMALDAHRRSLGGDPIMAATLMDIEATALRQVKALQQSLFNQWGF